MERESTAPRILSQLGLPCVDHRASPYVASPAGTLEGFERKDEGRDSGQRGSEMNDREQCVCVILKDTAASESDMPWDSWVGGLLRLSGCRACGWELFIGG